jgi:hypothetical protein
MNKAIVKRLGNKTVDVQVSGSAATIAGVALSEQIDPSTLQVGASVLVDIVNGSHVVLHTLSNTQRGTSSSGASMASASTVVNNALLADGSVPLMGNLAVAPGVLIDGYDISVLGQTIDNLQAADSVARTGHTVLTHASHLVATLGPYDTEVLIRHGIFRDKESLMVSNTAGEVETMWVVGNPLATVDDRGALCYRYTVTRRTGMNPPGIVTGWAAATLVNGLTHNGFISVDARENSVAAPNLRFVLHTDIDAGATEQIVRIGNLYGILGNNQTDFGFATGRLNTGDRYLAYNYSRNLLALRGADISLKDDAGVEVFRVWGVAEDDHQTGDARLGHPSGGNIQTVGSDVDFHAGGQRVLSLTPLGSRFRGMIWSGTQPGPQVGIGEENGQGLIAARNAAGVGQFVVRTGDENVHVHMGNPVTEGGYAQFADGEFTTDGVIRARAFELLGGGTIGSGVVLTNAGKFTAGTGNNVAVIDGEDAAWRIYAGHATPASAPFRVNQAGEAWLTNAHVTGEIAASAGAIGGWTINSAYLVKDTGAGSTSAGLAPNDYPFYAGATYANRATAPFRVTPAGAMTATAGNIAGWTIASGHLYAGAGASRAGMQPASYPFYAGSETPASAPFRVTPAGALTASNATVTGTINANAGSIGGWALGASALTGGNATLHSTGYLNLGTGNDIARLDAADATYRLWVGHATASSAPFRVTKAGALTASNATITGTINANAGNILGSLYVGASGNRLHLDGANKRFESTNFASGTSGFRIEGETGNAEFNNVAVRGALTATAIQYGYVLATNGSIWVVKAAGRSLNSFSAPKDGVETLDIEDPDGMSHAAAGGLWAVNDVIRLQEPLAGDFWGVVTAKTDMATYWQLTVEDRSSAGNGVFPAGATVLNYGQSGDGVVRITADASNSPYISIATHAGSPWTTLTERARLGNLTGISGASGYGLWTDNGYFTGTVNASAGAIGGWTIANSHLYAGSGSIRVGLNPPLYPFYAGSEVPSTAPFRVSANGFLVATNATIAGTVTASAGNIAGWTLAATKLYWEDPANYRGIGLATYDDAGGYAFWAGDHRPAYAGFRVSKSGALWATTATITGNITASSGSITGALTVASGGSVSDGSRYKLDVNGLVLSSNYNDVLQVRDSLTGTTRLRLGYYDTLSQVTSLSSDLVLNAGTNNYNVIVSAPGTGEIRLAGRTYHGGDRLGFFGVTPVARPAAYTFTNGTTDRTINCDSTTVAELADVVYTMWSDLRNLGLLQ